MNNGSNWQTMLYVNGSALSNTTSVSGLPVGTHDVRLDLISAAHQNGTQPSKEDWVRMDSFDGNLGGMITAQTINTTIDDSAWRNWTVLLTPAWNMMEQDASNWINTVCPRAVLDIFSGLRADIGRPSTMPKRQLPTATSTRPSRGPSRPALPPPSSSMAVPSGRTAWSEARPARTWSCWTTPPRLSTTPLGETECEFVRSMIDAQQLGAEYISYQSVLWHTSGLEDTNHTLELRNMEEGKRLSFDRLVALSRLYVDGTLHHPLMYILTSLCRSDPPPYHGPLPPMATPRPETTAAAGKPSPISTGGWVGIALGIGIFVIGLIIWALTAWTCVKGRVRRRAAVAAEDKEVSQAIAQPILTAR